MVTLSLLCPQYGERATREIDERFFPSSLRCKCGTRIPIKIKEDEPRNYGLNKPDSASLTQNAPSEVNM